MSNPTLQSLHHGEFLELQRRGHWEFVRRRQGNGGAAFMVATTPAAELVLVEQLRLPVERRVIELPAGIVGDEDAGETPLQAAHRELLEETGYRAGRAAALFDAPTTAGLSSEWSWFIRMWELERVHEGGGVGDEDIRTHVVPLAGIDDFLAAQRAQGRAVDLRIAAALYWLGGPLDPAAQGRA